MSTWNKVLVGLIIVATLPYAYLVSKAFKRQQELRQSIASDRQQLEQLEKDNLRLAEGEEGFPGIVDLQVALDRVSLSRGRVWENATAAVGADGTVQVTVAEPVPHQITTNLTLFAFDAPGDPGQGRYLGEFKVTAVAENQVTLAPALKPSPEAQEAVAAANGRGWTLYDIMPVDTADLFHGVKLRGVDVVPDLTAEAQRQLLAAQVALSMPQASPERQAEAVDLLLNELAKDGKPAGENDPADRVDPETRVYHRPLFDFATLLHEYELQQTLLGDAIAAAELQKKYTEDSLADARQQLTFAEKERDLAKERLARVTKERDAVQSHRLELVDALRRANQAIAALLVKNRQLAAALAKYQFQAVQPDPPSEPPLAPADQAALAR